MMPLPVAKKCHFVSSLVILLSISSYLLISSQANAAIDLGDNPVTSLRQSFAASPPVPDASKLVGAWHCRFHKSDGSPAFFPTATYNFSNHFNKIFRLRYCVPSACYSIRGLLNSAGFRFDSVDSETDVSLSYARIDPSTGALIFERSRLPTSEYPETIMDAIAEPNFTAYSYAHCLPESQH